VGGVFGVTSWPLGRDGAGSRKDASSQRAELDVRRLRKAVTASFLLLGAQLIALLTLSWVIYHRWSNTWDYAIRYQGWWGIAHGVLDPFSSVAGRFFLKDHFELINWPLAPLARLWPHGLWPLWIQDLMITAAEVAAVLIVRDALARGEWSRRIPASVAILLVSGLLIANPFIYETAAFDFHYQVVGAACFALLACREMMGGSRWRLVVFSVLCLACGDIAGTYLAAVGLGGVLSGRAYRAGGLALLGAGLGWFILASGLGANQGSSFLTHYGYLAGAAPGTAVGVVAVVKGALSDPGRGFVHLWSQRVDLFAYITSAGFFGLFTPWAVLPIFILVENGLGSGTGIAGTAYENFGAVIFLVPLSVLALGHLDRRLAGASALSRRRARAQRVVVPALLVVVGLYALGWAVVWTPRVPGQWVAVSSASAATLDQVEAMIPTGAEVVASQGVVGRFADRRWLYRISHQATFPLHTPDTYFVIAPNEGIELATIQQDEELAARLRGALGGRLLLHAHGIFLLELHRSASVRAVRVPAHPKTLPAWIGRTRTGAVVARGPAARWHVSQARSTRGLLLFGLDWQEAAGTYELTTTLANRSPVEIEVRDATAGQMLAQEEVAPGLVVRPVTTTFTLAGRGQRTFSGFGPFSYRPTAPHRGDLLEVRVISPGTGMVDLYSARLDRLGP
jgi:Predicted membrane protein (DUF2079)